MLTCAHTGRGSFFSSTSTRAILKGACKWIIKPKVTIGICVRNGEGSIEDAMKSVIDQDFPHELMELIFVDDGSDDKTLSIMKTCAQGIDIKTEVFHHKWRGLGATRNVVVNNANGEYLIWVDCDMRPSSDFVRKQVEFMEGKPEVGIGKGRYRIYETSSLVAYLENVEAIVEFLHSEKKPLSKPLGTGGSVYRVKAIREVGGFNESIKLGGEDIEAEHRIREAGWSLQTTSAEFFEMRRENWKALWKEYFWHGSGGTDVYRKISSHAVLYRMFPPISMVKEFFRSCNAYRLTHRAVVFLLPLHWIFKRAAWFLGFITKRAQMTKVQDAKQV